MPNAYRFRHDSHYQIDKRCPDIGLAELARRQHGVVARRQLTDLGLATGAVNVRVVNGRLHLLHRGVYAVGHTMLSDKGRWMAAILAAGPGAVLSHTVAAALWEMRPWRDRGLHVTTRAQRTRPGIRFHCSPLPADELTVHDGIPVTSPARTLFDLAGVVSLEQLRRAVNEAEIRRLWDAISLADLLDRHPRRPGAAAVRAVIATPGAGVTRSALEELFLGLLDDTRLLRPETNVALWIGGRFIEVDCLWREQRVIVELDGYETHRTRTAYENDRARDRMLTAAGWHVMRVTWRQLHKEPEAIVRDLRALLMRPESRFLRGRGGDSV
jgi:very-short-patch-repair endonuclease